MKHIFKSRRNRASLPDLLWQFVPKTLKARSPLVFSLDLGIANTPLPEAAFRLIRDYLVGVICIKNGNPLSIQDLT